MPARKGDPIKKVPLKVPKIGANGKKITERYRFVIDVGRKPDGKRDQKTYTYDTLKEARAERARIISDRAKGTYVRPQKRTVSLMIDDWLAGKRDLGTGTRRTYADSLKHAKDHIGHLEGQAVTKADIDTMITNLLAFGRRVGNARTRKLSARTVNVMLSLLTAVFESELAQGHLGRNVVRLAERPRQITKEMQTWTGESAAAFLQAVEGERLFAAWQLSLYGLRRGEVLGLRWSDVDLVAKTIIVRWARTSVAGEIVEKEPKTEKSRRTLPLDDDLVDALTALQLHQREEREAAGEAYAKPCRLADPVTGEVCAGDHVAVDELGRPYRPEWYGDRFAALAKRAGLPVIRLHDTRHTCGSLLHARGVPTADISKWLGHASAAFTLKTYVHSQEGALVGTAETLRRALQGSPAAPKSVV